jgi:predicted amidohydrolase
VTTFKGVTHAPGPDGMFSGSALCGADPATNYGGVLRLQQKGYTCLVCQDVAVVVIPELALCEGSRHSSQDAAFTAALTAGFKQWRQATCAAGHWHVTDGQFGGDA